MKPLNKAIRTARIQEDWKRSLYKILLNKQTTPHTTKKETPAELLYNRNIIRNGIPTCQQNPKTRSEMRE